MKLIGRILSALFIVAVMMSACEAAGTAETVNNAEELTHIKRLAIYYPDYYHYEEYKDEPPDSDAFMKVLFDASRVSKSYILSYDEIASKIKSDSGIDIKVLPKKEARRIFKEQIFKYADGYLFVGLANNSRVSMFFYVYAVNSNELVYSLQLQSGKGNSDKTVKSYQSMAEQFYKTFDKAVQEASKKKK